MPRANRHFLPNHIWHITHRCHKREFLFRLNNGNPFREDQWTETIAVGGMEFINEIRDDLGSRALGRSVVLDGEQHQLREVQQPYMPHFDPEKVHLRPNNAFGWDNYSDI